MSTMSTPMEIGPFDPAMSYTEATVVVSGTVTGAPVEEVDHGHARPAQFVIRYNWRTQLGHERWHLGVVEFRGDRVTEEGEPIPDNPLGRSATWLAADDEHMPPWLAYLTGVFFPTARLVVGKPGTVTGSDVQPLGALPDERIGAVHVSGVEARTSIRHFARTLYVHNAPVERLGGDGRSARYMVPDTLSLDHHWGAFEDVHGQWSVREVAVTGPWTDEHGNPSGASGTARVHVPPGWAVTHAEGAMPLHVGLVEVEQTVTEHALRGFVAASAAHRSAALRSDRVHREARAADTTGVDVAEDLAAEQAVLAGNRLLELLDQGAPIPRTWHGEREAVEPQGWSLHVNTGHPRAREILLAAAHGLTIGLGTGSDVAVEDPVGHEIAWFEYDRDHAYTDESPATA